MNNFRRLPTALLLMGAFLLLAPSTTRAQPPGGRGGFVMPQPGPCPLPILPTLAGRDDKSFYAKLDVPHGRVEQTTFENKDGKSKRMHVYLPPGYDENADVRFPVLYLNHGGGDDDSKWTNTDPQNGGHAQLILDNLIAAGKARPMIIVMPDTRGLASPAPAKPGEDDACTKEYLQSIIPHVEGKFRCKPGRESRAIAGLSMGGFVVLNTGLPHLDTFSELYVYSSGYFPDQLSKVEENFAELLKNPRAHKQFRVPLYFAAGETDFALGGTLRTMAVFNKHALRNFWVLSSGGHDWNNWRRYLHQTAQLMFPDCPVETIAPDAPKGFSTRRDGVPQGTVETVEYESKTVGNKRKAVVYTPPGFSKDRKYPVLYLLHGIGDDETGWTNQGAAAGILDNLYAEKSIAPMIVVMPNGRARKDDRAGGDWQAQVPAFEKFEDDLLRDLIPAIESRYPVDSRRDSRALAGLSMGGGQSLNFGLRHLDTFGWVGGFSSAPITKPVNELIPESGTPNPPKLLWISCGDEDFILDVSTKFHQGLVTRKIPHTWRFSSGGHTWDVWKNDLYFFSQKLFQNEKSE